jgi:hypothetical protein
MQKPSLRRHRPARSAGALVGALVALGALPLPDQGTRPGEHAAHRPAATTTARLMWLAIAAALARWPIPAERVAVDLATPVLFLAISIGVIVPAVMATGDGTRSQVWKKPVRNSSVSTRQTRPASRAATVMPISSG